MNLKPNGDNILLTMNNIEENINLIPILFFSMVLILFYLIHSKKDLI